MSATKVRERVDDIFKKYITEANVDKKLRVPFDELVILQKAMDLERDRAAKAKLQKDSQQAKYEQQVEANMKKEMQCKKLTEKLENNKKIFHSIQDEIKIIKETVQNHLSEQQFQELEESLQIVEANMKKSKIKTINESNLRNLRSQKRGNPNVRVSVPLPQIPQFAKAQQIDKKSPLRESSTNASVSTVIDDMRKKANDFSKLTNINESVSFYKLFYVKPTTFLFIIM